MRVVCFDCYQRLNIGIYMYINHHHCFMLVSIAFLSIWSQHQPVYHRVCRSMTARTFFCHCLWNTIVYGRYTCKRSRDNVEFVTANKLSITSKSCLLVRINCGFFINPFNHIKCFCYTSYIINYKLHSSITRIFIDISRCWAKASSFRGHSSLSVA